MHAAIHLYTTYTRQGYEPDFISFYLLIKQGYPVCKTLEEYLALDSIIEYHGHYKSRDKFHYVAYNGCRIQCHYFIESKSRGKLALKKKYSKKIVKSEIFNFTAQQLMAANDMNAEIMANFQGHYLQEYIKGYLPGSPNPLFLFHFKRTDWDGMTLSEATGKAELFVVHSNRETSYVGECLFKCLQAQIADRPVDTVIYNEKPNKKRKKP